MDEELRVLKPREYYKQLVLKGQRVDGRGLEDLRDIKVETNAIRTADSSSLVKLGNTSLVCGCIAQLVDGVNNSVTEDELIKISVSLPPICSNLAAADKYEHISQLLTRTLYNILEDSNCLNKENFYIANTDSHWLVNVEVICLNYDGCLIDGALIAILTALKSLILISKSRTDIAKNCVKFDSLPICSSFAIIGGRVLCDPTLEEESVAQSTFSITIDSLSNRLCQVHKVGGKAVSTTKLLKCIELAKERALKVNQKIGSFLNNGNERDMIVD